MATSIALIRLQKQSEDPMLQWVTFALENEIYGRTCYVVKRGFCVF